MTKKARTLIILADYFIEKGKILTEREYKADREVPVRYHQVKRLFTAWKTIERMIQRNHPEKYEQIFDEVNLERLAEAEAQLKAEEEAEKQRAADELAQQIKEKRELREKRDALKQEGYSETEIDELLEKGLEDEEEEELED